MSGHNLTMVAVCMVALVSTLTWAEDAADTMDHSGHQMKSDGMDHSGHTMDPDAVDHSGHDMNSEEMDHSGHGMDSGEMDHSGHDMPAAPAAAASDSEALRDPHAYSEGADFSPHGRLRLADEHNFWAVLIHRLEAVNTSDNSYGAFEGQAWYGRTYDRLNVKSELEIDSGELHESRTELLWSHAIAPFWDSQLGVRHDTGEDPDRSWLAAGVQGLAPYWFHVDATFYIGEHADTAIRFAAEYDMLFTQRLILQPKIETTLYGQKDDERELGSGLSSLSAGLRLRYEITRQFAPYVGVEWAGLYGGTADHAREANAPTEEMRWIAGVHMWF